VAVIGLPHESLGEEICAVIVQASPIDESELLAWCQERLGRHKYPRRFHFTSELPLGPSHKVLKRELRRLLS
jgi:long-chain acyl-CoA synthetase